MESPAAKRVRTAMLRRRQSKRADGGQARTYYKSQSWSKWLYVQDGRKWRVYASDGTWVQNQRALSRQTRAQLKEITEAEAEALLAAGRAESPDVQQPLGLHVLPSREVRMRRLLWIVPVIVAGVFIALNTVFGLPTLVPNWDAMPRWLMATHVAVDLAVWIGLCLWAWRDRRRHPPSGYEERSWWQRGSGGPG
jgi:hypothetical protein